jgi:cardiolipin synthase
MEEKKEKILNLPNLISLSRILLIPIFVYMVLNQRTAGAFWVFLIASSTDFLDGIAARTLNQKTKLGALLDPASDKLFMTVAFIVLTIPSFNSPNVIPLWLTLGVIGRDVTIVGGSFYLYLRIGQKTFPPTLVGKASTVCQFTVLCVVLLLNMLSSHAPQLLWFYLLTLLLTFWSGMQYVRIGQSWFKEHKDQNSSSA